MLWADLARLAELAGGVVVEWPAAAECVALPLLLRADALAEAGLATVLAALPPQRIAFKDREQISLRDPESSYLMWKSYYVAWNKLFPCLHVQVLVQEIPYAPTLNQFFFMHVSLA